MSKIELKRLPKGNLLATLTNEDDDEFVMKESSYLNETLLIGVADRRRVYLTRGDAAKLLPLLRNFVKFGTMGVPWEFVYKDEDGLFESKIIHTVSDDKESAIAEFETLYPELNWRTIRKMI